MANAGARARLLALLTQLSFARRQVVLASGKTSDFFIDCKQTVLTAEGHALAGALLFESLSSFARCDAVAGVELGGCPLASAVSLVSFERGAPLDAIYVRKAVKDHGSKRLLEGDGRLAQGHHVVILEDVVTTGASTLRAAARLRDAGYVVSGVVALVDRLEGGRAAIEEAGIVTLSLYTRDDFVA
jgi:orotate phosphoribosyltransferase